MWRLKGQGGPSWPVSPDMFKSNDYLSVDLEHPRKAALVRVFVEHALASTGTAFKFDCVDFRDSAVARKYVANIKLNCIELSIPADDYLTSHLSWCLRIQRPHDAGRRR